MESVREYLVSVTCAALLGSILCAISDEKQPGGTLVKLLCGVFLCLTMIRPFCSLHFNLFEPEGWKLTWEGEAATRQGQEYARQAKMQIIKERTTAYILDKASLYHLDLTVSVSVSEDELPLPESVVIRGQASPYAKEQLQRMMETELGIPKENQRWMDMDSD